jgi:Beta/Gamma crystallin
MTKILNEFCRRGVLSQSMAGKHDSYLITIPATEVFHSSRLTILESLFGGDARIISQPAKGAAGTGSVIVEWQGGPSSTVQYQIEAFSSPPAIVPSGLQDSVTAQMTDFIPSENGFHFDNRFEAIPVLPLIGDLKVGDASKGLCGGMVYAALDYFSAGLEMPEIPVGDLSAQLGTPVRGSLFDYLGRRLVASFDLPFGVLNYIELMQPKFPDAQARRGVLGLEPRSRAWRMVRQEWPRIKRRLDTGQPCPLGLVCVKTTDIRRIGQNHQVLAYGYDLVGTDLTLFIYDPNVHDRNDITLKLNIGDPEHKVGISYTGRDDLNCFFVTSYAFSLPPDVPTLPGRAVLFEDANFGGRSIDVVHSHADLTLFKRTNFNDRTSSLTILSGNWVFYRNAHFAAPFIRGSNAVVLGPGSYPDLAKLGIQDDEISSLQEVETPEQ